MNALMSLYVTKIQHFFNTDDNKKYLWIAKSAY